MLSGLVRMATASAADAAKPVIRDAIRRAVLLAIALFLLVGVVAFAELAFFFWLRTHMAPYLAALIVAGVTLIISLLILIIALSGGSSSRSDSGRARSASAARETDAREADEVRAALSDPVGKLAADAEALGMMFARDAKGYQLVLGAFVVGMMLGRGK
jgi:hypothetical protein